MASKVGIPREVDAVLLCDLHRLHLRGARHLWRLAGVNIFRFLYYIREEILIVLGTSSSESVLPRMIDKLQKLGCKESVVGLVVPTGYSFNLDGMHLT